MFHTVSPLTKHPGSSGYLADLFQYAISEYIWPLRRSNISSSFLYLLKFTEIFSEKYIQKSNGNYNLLKMTIEMMMRMSMRMLMRIMTIMIMKKYMRMKIKRSMECIHNEQNKTQRNYKTKNDGISSFSQVDSLH